jgi:hypothetical protein
MLVAESRLPGDAPLRTAVALLYWSRVAQRDRVRSCPPSYSTCSCASAGSVR